MANPREAGVRGGSGGACGQDRYEAFVRGVKDRLHALGLPKSASRPLGAFLRDLARVNGPSGVGLIYREAETTRPAVDIYVLWPDPLDVENENLLRSMDAVGNLHGVLACAWDGTVDTFLSLVTAESTRSLAAFGESMSSRCREAGTAQSLGVAALSAAMRARVASTP